MADDTPDHVLATYREIAERFRLGSIRAARTKTKRAGWRHDPPNHPYDPLRIRVPRDLWHQAGETQPDQSREPQGSKNRETQGSKPRGLGQQRPDAHSINGLDALVAPLREQLERERGRADAAEAELAAMRERVAELRESKAAAEAKAEAAEARVDDLMVQAGKLAEVKAKADLLQQEVDRVRGEAERLGRELAVATAKPARRRWFGWGRRRGA